MIACSFFLEDHYENSSKMYCDIFYISKKDICLNLIIIIIAFNHDVE